MDVDCNGAVGAAEVDRLLERVRTLTFAWEGVSAERSLMVYRAVRAGASRDVVARRASLTVAEVDQVVVEYARDPDTDSMCEGPDWVELYSGVPGRH
ncbi:MAG: hypothetical protein WCA46_08905 [Actinocatenispora sp.]